MANFKELLKDKNKLLILIPIVLGILLLVVLYVGKKEQKTVAPEESSQAFLEPEAAQEKKVADKKEAYKLEREETLRKQRELEDSEVRGSDFYFNMQDEAFNERLKAQIKKIQSDPYTQASSEYKTPGQGRDNSAFANRMRQQLDDIESKEALDQIIKEATKEDKIRKELEKSNEFRDKLYKKFIAQASGKDQKGTAEDILPEVKEEVAPVVEPIFIVEDGKRKRRSQFALQQKTNLIKASVYGDQVIVSGSAVKMRLLEPLWVGGVEIPANTIFHGTASVGASRLKITVENLRYGKFISPVAFTIYDSDAIEGLNLPNNMKAAAAKKMELGLLQGVQLPISSIGTITSEVTSAITATTQVAKQILNQNLSQTKVHLKANYNLFVKEETKEDKKKREAEDAEIERQYKEMLRQQNAPVQKNPLTSLIESL